MQYFEIFGGGNAPLVAPLLLSMRRNLLSISVVFFLKKGFFCCMHIESCKYVMVVACSELAHVYILNLVCEIAL